MTKNCLFALMLASVALWMGCARGLQSIAPVTVATNPANQSVIAVSLTVQFVATVNGVSSTAVNWSLSGSSCTGSACGTIDSAGLYTAPTTLASGKIFVTVTATSQADSAATGQLTITVLPITVYVTPTPVQVGQGLVQQFTAVTIPDNAPQTFNWTCKLSSGADCANFVPGANNAGLMVYTAADATCGNGCISVTATSALNPSSPSSGSAKISVVSSRVSGIYAFRFSGYDNAQNPVELAGSVTLSNSGTVTGGVEDEVIGTGASQGHYQYSITSGGYVPSSLGDNNTNNAGTLTLTSGASATQFEAVLDSSGGIRMIESDGNGHGSGVMQKSAALQFNTAPQTFVFLFTGVDPIGNRVGFVGLLPLDGTATATTKGNISGGMLDINEGGSPIAYTGITGTYGPGPVNGAWPMTLMAGGQTWGFNVYVGAGQTTNATNPLTLFAISTDPPSIHPVLSGTVVFQDTGTTYDKTALNNNPAVSHLDGLDSTGSKSVVALAVSSGDSNGNISGSFDALNFSTPPGIVSAQSFNTIYCPDTANPPRGRFVVNLFASGGTCQAPVFPFVFYASGANRGFLLDQSSPAVMAGAMDPQGKNLSGSFAGSELPGTYAAATVSSGTSGVNPLAANLTLTYPGFQSGSPVYNAAGTLYDPGVEPPASGSYAIQITGSGSITFTNADKFVFYAIDTSHFWMIQTWDSSLNPPAPPANPSVIFAQQ